MLSARPADYEWSAVATAQLGLKHHVAEDLEGLSWCQQAQQKIEGWTSLSSQLQERRFLKWGGPIFHYATFAAHVLGILILKTFTDFLGIPEHAYHRFSGAAGTLAAVLAINITGIIPSVTNCVAEGYDCRSTVGVWFRSLFYFHPEAAAMTTAPLIVQIHATASWLIWTAWPSPGSWSMPRLWWGNDEAPRRRRRAGPPRGGRMHEPRPG